MRADIKQNCDCALCKNNHDFTMPNELLSNLQAGKVAVFAGAGVSTESKTVLNTTFYESIAGELGIENSSFTFPELMEQYCARPNGRFNLLRNIKGRFDTIDSFPELNKTATRFHQELSTFFSIKNIITTNWDTYFEKHCGATPFVSDPDLAFWDVADRKVLKIHGSITNFGSIVATTSDYKKCEKNLRYGLIGAQLKSILATQTVVFVGYSFTDSDFSYIYRYVKSQMKDLHKQSYVVTPFANEAEKFRRAGLLPIVTDGSYFFQQVKAHAIADGVMLSDENFIEAEILLDTIRREHHRLHKTIKAIDFPQLIFAATYQDGMMHSLERAIEMRGTGLYSSAHRIRSSVGAYGDIQKEKLSQKRYDDVSYIEGYINGAMSRP